DLAADERREGPCPSSGELAEIIVGSDRVAAWPELLDHVLDARNDLLLAHRAGTERVGIGNATLVLVRVEIKLLGLIDDRSNRLALGAGETSNQHVDLVLLYEPSRQLLPECVVALTVRREELGFAAQDAFLAGVDQDVRILGKNHIAFRLRPAVADDGQARAVLADHGRLRGELSDRAEAAGAHRPALQRLAFVDLLDGELRRMELLQPIDGQ